MQEILTIESINFDYIPGEAESRRVWYITLRRPPVSLSPGQVIRVDSFRGINIAANYGTRYFRVNDIYGRYVVVDHVNKNDVIHPPNNNHRVGIYSYAQRPQSQIGPNSYFEIL